MPEFLRFLVFISFIFSPIWTRAGLPENFDNMPLTGGNVSSGAFTYKVNDGSSDSNTATVSVGINAVNDAPIAGMGTALSLESANSEGVQVANNSSLNWGTSSFTLEAWVKRPSGSGFFTVAGKQSSSTTTGWYLRFNDNRLSFSAGTYPANTYVDAVSSINDNTWHHVAAVLDAVNKKMSIYIDGRLDASASFSTNYTINCTTPFGIGVKPSFGEYFNGSIDEVRVWNAARTADQLNDYKNTTLSGNESGLVGYWNFEEGSGTTASDRGPNGFSGTLSGNGNEWAAGAIPYAITINEGSSISIRLGGSDLDTQSSPTAVIATLPAHGKLYQTNDGITKGSEITSVSTALSDNGGNPRRAIYEPAAGYGGADSFTYSVNDGSLSSANTQTVNLSILSIPKVSSVSVPANGTYKAGNELTFTVNYSESVTVNTAAGTPALALTIGSTSRNADYLSGSGSSALVFKYTVQSGEADADGVSVSDVSLNGGTIRNSSNADASTTLNNVPSLAAVLVDGVTPTVSSIYRVTTSPTNATSLDFTVTFSESVSGVDASDFSLTATGSASGSVASVSGSGNSYTVTVNSVSGAGTIRLDLNSSGTAISDAAGNNIGSGYTSGQTYTIDAVAPSVASVQVPSDGTYKLNGNLDFTVNFDEAVTVNTAGGTPYIALTLNTGGTVNASYISGSSTSALIFRYTVASGNLDADGLSQGLSITANGGTLKDDAGNNATLTLNNVGSTALVKVDGVVPTLSVVTIASNNATTTLARPGDVITLTITSSETINTPTVTIAGQTASVSGSGSTYSATYTTSSSDADGIIPFNISFSDLAGNAGTAVSATTNRSSVTFDATAPAVPSGLAATSGDAQVSLSWSANSESDLKSYKIYAGTSSNPTFLAKTVTAPITSSTMTGLTNGTTYYYRITAVDKAGNESNYSTTVSEVPKASQTITFNALSSKTYGDASFDLSATATSGLTVSFTSSDPSIASVSGITVTVHKAGSVTITAQQSGDGTYLAATDVPQTLTIGKKAVTVTADAKSKTYGDADPALTYSITSGALVGTDTFSGSLTRDAGENIGTYAINQGTLALSSNYNLSYVGANLTIGKKAVTVTADAKNKTYGDTDPALTYSITSGALVGTDAFSGSLTRDAGENIGTYAINQGTLALSSNYNLSYVGANLTIGKKAVTVTAEAKSKTYGDTDPALTYSITSGALVGTDAFSGSLTRDAGENIETYAINQGTLSLGSNYDLSYVGANLTIGKKAVTVTADAKSKTYGDTDPALTYSITSGALVGTDTFSGNLTRDVGENIGTYAINQGTLALSSNYNLSYVGANLVIGKKAVTVTADAKNKTYGDTDPALTYSITSGALVGTDTFSGSLTRDAGENAGTYTINEGTLALSSNYNLSYVGANLTIGKKAITVTAEAKSKTYGDTDPALTYSITSGALVGTDAFSGNLTRDVGENIGTYAINQGTLALSSNYNLSYLGANLAIGKKAVTVTAEAKSKTYGDTDPALTYSITSGALVGTDTFSGTLTRDAGENAGTYTIKQGTLALSGNYDVTYTGANLTINKKALIVTAENKSKTYGDTNPTLTVSYSGLVNGETTLSPAPSVTTAVTNTSGVGTYDINVTGTATNYSISFVKGTLTVTKAALTITADNKEKYQGLALPTFTASYSGFVNGETSSVLTTQPSFATTATAMSPQGTYPITVSGATAANYAITFVPGTLTVKPGYPTSITLAASTLYENAATGTLTGTLSSTSADPSATFTYTLVSGTGDTDNASFKISGNQLQTNAVLNFENKSSYSVLIRSTTQYGLSLDKQFTISLNNVNEQPTLNDIAAQTICYTSAEQTVALSGITAGEDAGQATTVSVSSSNNNLFKSLTVSQASNGNAQVRYTVADGSSGSAVVNVMVMDNGGTANGGVNTILKSFVLTVNALPVPGITTDKGVTSISKGEELVLQAEGGSQYQWLNANGILGGQNSQSLRIRPDATTTYRVMVTNAGGCTESKDITIEVREDYVMLKGSNLISPNNDGINDVFKIDNIDMYPNNEVKIFDRAGRLIYSKKNYSKDGEWTGTLNGSPLAEDTYYYVVDFGSNKPKLKGYITIIRE